MLASLTRSGSPVFDPIIMVKGKIEQSGQRGREIVLISLNPYAIVIDENQREGGTIGEKGGAVVCFFQSTCQGKG